MVTFRIPDMTCGHCAGTIARAIAAEDPGARVEFDIAGHLVHVTPATAEPAELESAIRQAGYTPAAEATPRPRAGGCGCGCGPASTPPIDLHQSNAAGQGGCCGR